MPEPMLSNARHDPLLENFLVEFANAPSSHVYTTFTTVPVALPAGKYKAVKKGELFRDRVKVRPMGSPPAQVGFQFEDKSYAVEEEGLETTIDDRERANFNLGGRQIERIKTKQLMEEIQTHLDRKWANTFFKTGVWTTDIDLGTTSTPWDAANSEPAKDVRGQMRTVHKLIGKKPNRLVLGATVFDALMNHADLIGRVSGGSTTANPAIADLGLMSRYFFPDDPTAKVFVAEAIMNTADEGLTPVMNFIFSANAYLLCYVDAAPAIGVATAGANFAWTGLMSNPLPEPGIAVSVLRGRDDRASSDWFQVKIATDFAVVSADLGLFAHTVVTAT
jgi:hypothetical protein